MKKLLLHSVIILLGASVFSSCYYGRKTGCPSQVNVSKKSIHTIV